MIPAARPTQPAPPPAVAIYLAALQAFVAALTLAETALDSSGLDVVVTYYAHALRGYTLLCHAEAPALRVSWPSGLAEAIRLRSDAERRLAVLADWLLSAEDEPRPEVLEPEAEMAVTAGGVV